MARATPAEIGELKTLAGKPEAQAERAAELILLHRGNARGNAVIQAALAVLIRTPQTGSRPALLALYEFYDAHAARDPACYIRSQIIQALRPVATPADLEFFCAAAATYVFPPPQFDEEGSLLRANALLVIAQLDEDAARYAAARLLFDEYTAPMSGEPAVTAAQVLAQVDDLVSLYAYVMQSAARIMPEVGAQALRSLARLPQMQLEQVITRYTDPDSAPTASPLIVGLFDLFLALDPMPAAGRAYLWAFLQENSPLDLYRYLATLLVTTNTQTGWSLFEEIVQTENVPVRLGILRESLDVALDVRRAASLIKLLDPQLAKK